MNELLDILVKLAIERAKAAAIPETIELIGGISTLTYSIDVMNKQKENKQ